ncbi:MAG: hypothetical protein ICV68_17725 [Pyrinomonadaceae bacterium]|nr:hypothetical protein [Pyrinomonadaceae bacterium]
MPQQRGAYRPELLLLAFGAALFAVLLGVNAITPPANWDSLTYHLTFPVEWYKQQRLALVVAPFGDPAPTYYPINVEIVYFWLLVPLHSLALANMGQAVFVIGAALGAYSAARHLGFAIRPALWASILTLCIPMLMVNGVLWSYNDAAMGATLVIALSFVLQFHREPTVRRACLCGLALGLFIGTKGPALLYSAPLFVGIFYRLSTLARHTPLRRVGAITVTGCLALVPFAAYSYVRNWIITGNPLYPITVSVAGTTLWPGSTTFAWYQQHPFHAFEPLAMLYQPGYVPHWAVVLVALPYTLWTILTTPQHRGRALVLLGLLGALFGVFYFCLPIRDVRYLIPVQIVGCLIIAHALSRLRYRWLVSAVLGMLVSMSSAVILLGTMHLFGPRLLDPQPVPSIFDVGDWPKMWAAVDQPEAVKGLLTYLGALVLVTALGIVCSIGYGWMEASRRARWVRYALLGVLVLGLPLVFQVYDAREFEAYGRYRSYVPAWAWLNQHTDGDTIAFVGTNVPLPLYGARLKNDVVYVSVNDRLYRHEYAQQGYRDELNFAAWIDNLAEQHVDFLFVRSAKLQSDPPPEERWAAAHPEAFSLVYDQPPIHIWRIDHEMVTRLAAEQ